MDSGKEEEEEEEEPENSDGEFMPDPTAKGKAPDYNNADIVIIKNNYGSNNHNIINDGDIYCG